jgi:hypothetical protein
MCCGSKRSAIRGSVNVAGSASIVPRAPTINNVPANVSANVPASRTNVVASRGHIRAAAANGDLTNGQFPALTIRYLETSPIRVWGPVTRRAYDFSGTQPTQSIDLRDAAVLVRSALFLRA